jgi:hypothetical protein
MKSKVMFWMIAALAITFTGIAAGFAGHMMIAAFLIVSALGCYAVADLIETIGGRNP